MAPASFVAALAALAAALDPLTFSVEPPVDPFGDGFPVSVPPFFELTAGIQATGAATLSDGSLLLVYTDRLGRVSGDLSSMYEVVWHSAVAVAPHPDGSAIVLNADDHKLLKYGIAEAALTELATDSNVNDCGEPSRAVVQQTGNQRVFALCMASTEALCQYNADLSSRSCISIVAPVALDIAPDDTYLVVRDDNLLRKYTVNDGAGTLTTAGTLDISGSTTSIVNSLVILADNRIVIPDASNSELEVVNPAFSAVQTSISVTAALGGINPSCVVPFEVAVDATGTGDVFVACDSSQSLLIISNDLSTTALDIGSVTDLGYLPTKEFDFVMSTPATLNQDGTRMFVGGSHDIGFFFLDLTGAASAGLAGSYAAPALSVPQSESVSGLGVGENSVIVVGDVVGAVVLPDGKVLLASRLPPALTLLSADYETLLDTVTGLGGPASMAPHPDGSAIVLDHSDDIVFKYVINGTAITETAQDFNSGTCDGPSRVVVQRTGNQRVFVLCINAPDAVCQHDADLSGRVCTALSTTDPAGLAIAPDDSFLVVRDDNTLRKYTINDGAGTLTETATLDISGTTVAAMRQSVLILSSDRILIPDKDTDQIHVVDFALTSVTSTINVNSGSLGGITPSCDGPVELATAPDGTGDVVVVCQDSISLLVLSNDLATTALEPIPRFLAGIPFFDTAPNHFKTPLSVADALGTTLYVGGGDNVALYSLVGGGSSGLAGSYATPLFALADPRADGVILTDEQRFPPIDTPVGVVDYGDGSMAVAMGGSVNRVLLTSTDFTTVYDASPQLSVTSLVQMIAHPDSSAIVIDRLANTVCKYTSTGSALVQDAVDSAPAECSGPTRVVVQQTGNQRIFVMCTTAPDALCQYDADLGNRMCIALSTTEPQGLDIAPDDTFLVIRDDDVLRRFLINDTAGTLSPDSTLDISAHTTSVAHSLVILSDHRILLSDRDNDQIEVVDPSFASVSSVGINFVSLGGITVTCDGPDEIVTDHTGLGDVVIGCEESNVFLVLSNDLSSTAQQIDESDLGFLSAISVINSSTQTSMGFLPNGELFYGGTDFFRVTGTPSVGAGGDPVVTDLAGHRFVVGTEPFTQYVLLRSPDGTDEVSFRTSGDRGMHDDYFINSITVTRAGCGSVTVQTPPDRWGTEIVGGSGECMATRLLRGDQGLTVAALGDGSAAVVVMPHHQPGESFSFLNIKIAGDVAKLRREGWAGVLGDEAHTL